MMMTHADDDADATKSLGRKFIYNWSVAGS